MPTASNPSSIVAGEPERRRSIVKGVSHDRVPADVDDRSDLADAGLISRTRAAAIAAVDARYAVAVTPAMAELIDASDAADPIARQFVPDPRELDRRDEERAIRSATISKARCRASCTATPTACC